MNPDPFIPAKESRFFITFFDGVVRLLCKMRFSGVYIKQEYIPSKKSRTIYFLNHTSWWDGLIPLLLNQKRFRQRARAMMEDKQMREHGFFKRIGAFSVNLKNPRSVIRSLRYAVESMKRPNASLFIYPEGEIRPFSLQKPEFKSGLSWIVSKYSAPDVVPIAIYFSMKKSSKPELFIQVGEPVDTSMYIDLSEKTAQLEEALQQVLKNTVETAHDQPNDFQKLL
jgi:1-acyl-sn-glycerol-3-phosphate acyltransferase